MQFVLSPAKALDYERPAQTRKHTLPQFVDHAARLIEVLQTKSPQDIAQLMDLSDALAELNVGRYAAWSPTFSKANSKQAILAFNGDVYEGLDAPTLGEADLAWAQDRLMILSGLYGVLRPLDWMQPYRLEMGTKLPTRFGKDLYAFWKDTVTPYINQRLQTDGSGILVNLASQEYFKVVRTKELTGRVVECVFEDWKAGSWKVISFYAKRARGLMARHAILNRARDLDTLRAFDAEGYVFDQSASDELKLVFRRRLDD